ncbi:MAG: hypothetical protein ACRDSL_20900 [Pseudonocardiaceae bacterium]
MRAHILGTGLLLGLAATALGGPVALADTGTETDTHTNTETAPFLAAPGELLVPGQELQIQGYCPDPAAGTLSSDALTNIQVLYDPEAGPPNLNASGVVAEGTAPGVYSATMDCAGETLGVTFTVIEPDDSTHDLPADFVHIHPSAAHPGETVAAQASCDTDEVTLTSPVLRTATLAPDPEGHQPWALHGTTTVTEDAEPGDYPVSAQCPGGTVQTTITVLGDRIDTGDQTGDQTEGDDGQVSRVPKGAPETGDGDQGVSVPLLALGLVLGATAGAGAIAWREVRR